MEVIQLAGYTNDEKLHIAKRYLVPRQLEANGLKPSQIEFADPALTAIIEEYTREAGVRNLEREIGTVCRKVAREVAEGKVDGKVKVSAKRARELLGKRRVLRRAAPPHQGPGRRDRPRLDAGRRRGPVHRGDGDAGRRQADDHRPARRRDARVGPGRALLRARAPEGARPRAAPRTGSPSHDIHIHVPAGAVPKDGPSAGVAMATALASLVSGRPVATTSR